MIPIRLHLSGFLSYQDPVDLDFSSFDLACISGSNGAGKSSLLDAMTWALFGQARRRDDTVINSHTDAAEVIFEFRYEGNLYRVQRVKPRDKATLLEFYVCAPDGSWKPMTERSMRETEGRITSTLRMDYETFTNSSFLMQGRADQFAQQRPGDRKRVLSAILGLEVWEQYRADAVERRKKLEAETRVLDGQIEEIDVELSQEGNRKQRLQEAEARLEQLHQLRQAKETALAAMQRLAATLAEQRRMVDFLERSVVEVRHRYGQLQTELSRLQGERNEFLSILADQTEVETAYQTWQNLRADLERWEAVAANFREIEAKRAIPLTKIATENSRLEEEQRTLAAQKQAVEQELARLPEIEQQGQSLMLKIHQLEAEVALRSEMETELHEMQAHSVDVQAENRSLRDAMKSLKERIDRLEKVEGAVCPICGQPLSAEERSALITSLEAEGKEMGGQYRKNQELLTQAEEKTRAIQMRITGLARTEEELRVQSRQYDRLEAERQRIDASRLAWQQSSEPRLAEVSRMLVKNDFAQDARAVLAEIDEQSKALGYDSAAHDAVRRAEQAGRSAEARMRALEAARASLTPLERQIAGLETQVDQEAERLAGQEKNYQEARSRYEQDAAQLPDLNEAETQVYSIQAEENRLRMEVGMVRQSVSVLDTQRARRARLAAERDQLNQQIARLKVLERAFSKDGVPALLIEQALPEIEDEANEILDRLSNGQMSVHFETQRQFKDKSRDDRKETLDIIISDGAGPREYELFSGGEAFRVNFAIRLALSRVLAQRAGARLQTLVIDEGFGSQDADGRQRLIEAINLVRPDFQKILVITHMEELKEAFPARILVEKTPRGSRVQVVN
jgi:exonuclease SbcC